MDISNHSDADMIRLYEGNGLFAKIIDTPAEEALKHGFTLENIKDQELIDFYQEALEELDWDETAINAIRWARLFGGSLAVMLINDGRGIDEPLNIKTAKAIYGIKLYDRSLIGFVERNSNEPDHYSVYSKYGSFIVHRSRCLTFKNGALPEKCSNSLFEFWGIPEFYKLQKALSETELSHGYAVRLLEQAHQTIYKVHQLSETVATDEGADIIRRRLELIALTRGILNSIAIDKNDDYALHNTELKGVKDVVKSAYYHLSAVSSIPRKLLFGEVKEEENWWRGYESTERMWQNYIESLQARMLYNNLHYLLTVIFQIGANSQEIRTVPKIKIRFQSMRNLSAVEEAQADSDRATAQLRRAQTAQTHIDIGSLSPGEVRKGLASVKDFDIATLLDKKHE